MLMRAIIDDKGARGWRSNVGGNLPTDGEVAAKIKATGFFDGPRSFQATCPGERTHSQAVQ